MAIYYLTLNKPNKFYKTDEFSSFIHNQLEKDNKQLWDNFDNFFDKDFFQKQPEPFAAMEKFHQDIEQIIEELGTLYEDCSKI